MISSAQHSVGDCSSVITLPPTWRDKQACRTAKDAPFSLHDVVRCSQQSARSLLPMKMALDYHVLPLSLENDGSGNVLTTLVEESFEAKVLREIPPLLGAALLVEVVPNGTLTEAISLAYETSAACVQEIIAAAQDSRCESVCDSAPDSTAGQQSTTPRFFRAILYRALLFRASDIHFEPLDEKHYGVRIRIDGMLEKQPEFTVRLSFAQQLLRYAKVLCSLDTTATWKSQDGGFTVQLSSTAERYRASFIPQILGEKLVLRHLERYAVSAKAYEPGDVSIFSALGLTQQGLRMLLRALSFNQGCIITSGPTGSGKSTLLYAVAQFLNSPSRHIATIEDPVERIIPGVSQTEVASLRGASIEDYLPAVLRQDPDVIIVGELRNKRSAQLALEAALTGHLVLATLHAATCADVYRRLVFMGVERELVGSAVQLSISQRLIQKNCPQCRVVEPTLNAAQEIFSINPEEHTYIGCGCDSCRGSGFQGRLAFYDFLSRDVLVDRMQTAQGVFAQECDVTTDLRMALCRGEICQDAALSLHRIFHSAITP